MMTINETNDLQLNRYEIIEKIGEGGMADVYRAYDKVLQRECAIKILREELNSNQIALLRFQREADAASKLHHPNIVQIYDVGETNNRNFIVMEYVHGKTLKHLIQQRGAIEKKEAVFIMQQIAEALVVAHEHGVIHRDIKPQNIMIKADGQVKITDFGIAMTQGSVQLTAHDSVMGSVHYMAPECARGEQASQQADIYSMGIVFYEMLTGEVPFKGDGAVQVAMKHLQEEMKGVREYNGTIEQSIENIIIKATAKNKTLRYQNAQEMLEDIKHCFEPTRANTKKLILEPPVENSTTRVFTEVAVDTEPPKNNKRNNFLIGGIIMVAVVLFAVVVSTLLGGEKPSNSIRIPDVTNVSRDAAMQQLTMLGLEVVDPVIYEEHATIEKESVIRTEPAANTEVDKGTQIIVYVSSGEFLEVEDYSGKLLADVQAIFTNTMIRLDINFESSSSLVENTIIRQSGLDIGTRINPGQEGTIVLYVAKAQEIEIPPLVGVNINTAKGILENLGAVVELKAISSEALSDEEFSQIKTMEVIKSDPEADSIYIQKQDSKVILEYYEESARVVPNKTRLKTMIDQANEVDKTIFTPETVKVFETALQRAENILELDKQNQTTVDDAANNLQSAMEGLTILVDKVPLQTQLQVLENLDISSLSTDDRNWRDETVVDTKMILNTPNVSQSQLDTQWEIVSSVIEGLKSQLEGRE